MILPTLLEVVEEKPGVSLQNGSMFESVALGLARGVSRVNWDRSRLGKQLVAFKVSTFSWRRS